VYSCRKGLSCVFCKSTISNTVGGLSYATHRDIRAGSRNVPPEVPGSVAPSERYYGMAAARFRLPTSRFEYAGSFARSIAFAHRE